MTLTRKTQIGLIITALVLFVLLFIAPKTYSGKLDAKEDMMTKTTEVASLETFITMALSH